MHAEPPERRENPVQFFAGIPDPLSAKLMMHSSAVTFADTAIRPGRLSLNFTAFESKL